MRKVTELFGGNGLSREVKMIKALKYKLYSFLTSGTYRFLCSLGLMLFLSGCENDNDTSLSGDGNFNGQAACWQAQLADVVTAILDTLYNDSSRKVVTDAAGGNLMLVAFALWMAFKLLKVLASFKEESLGEVWTEIFQKMFLVAFCAWFIIPNPVTKETHMDDAINLFVLPIYQTLLELGLRSMSEDGGGTLIHLKNFPLGDFGTIDFTHATACPTELSLSVTDGHLREPIRVASNCVICEINSRLNSGIKIGVVLISSLQFFALLLGVLIVLLFTAAKFGFVVFLLDSLFRLNFAVFLLPVLLMGVPFNYTRKWSKQGFLLFINSSGIMLFMGLLINICVLTLEGMLNDFVGDDFDLAAAASITTPMLGMLLVSLLLVNIPGFSITLADKFIGGGMGPEFAKKISKFVEDMGKKAGAKIIDSLTDGATTTLTEMMEKYEHTRRFIDTVKQIKNKASGALDSLAGYDDD